MSSSINITVQNKVIDLLKTITTGNGFNNTVQLVTKRYMDVDKIGSYPSVVVQRGQWSRSWADASKALFKTTARLAVIGYVNGNTDTTDSGKLTDLLDSLSQDVENCIADNTNEILSVDDGAKSLLVTTGYPLLDDVDNFGAFILSLEVEFYHDANV